MGGEAGGGDRRGHVELPGIIAITIPMPTENNDPFFTLSLFFQDLCKGSHRS